MAQPVDYNGYKIATDALNPELQSQIEALGLAPQDFTAEAMQQRDLERSQQSERQAVQDMARQAQGDIQVPQGMVRPQGGINAAADPLAGRQTLLEEVGRRRTAQDEELVAERKQDQARQLELNRQYDEAVRLGLDPEALGLTKREVEQQAEPLLARTRPMASMEGQPLGMEPVQSGNKLAQPVARGGQLEAAELATSPATAQPVTTQAGGDIYSKAIDALNASVSDYQKNLKASRDREADALKPVLERIDELSKKNASGEIKDPWANKSFFQKALAAVAIGLGAVGSSIQGTRNFAADMINQNIQTELERQKAEANRRSTELKDLNSVVSNVRQSFKDERAQDLQALGLLQTQAAQKFEIISAQAKNQATREQAMLQNQLLQTEAMKNMAQAREIELGNAQKSLELVGGGRRKPTKFDERRDAEFAKVASEFFDQQKIVELDDRVDKLKGVVSDLEKYNLTGGWRAVTPDFLVRLFNEKSIDAQEIVEQVAQLDLKRILGGQFGEREGEQLIKRAYNPNLSEEANIRRVVRLITQLDKMRTSLRDKYAYVQEFGTLQGYEGPDFSQIRTAEDFINADFSRPGQTDELIASENFYQNVLNNPQASPTDRAEARLALQEIGKLRSFD